MKETIDFIQNLIEDMEDCGWTITSIVEVKEVSEEDKIFGIVDDEVGRYEKQDNEFIRQWTGYCEDDFHGYLLKPIEGNKYLKISYWC